MSEYAYWRRRLATFFSSEEMDVQIGQMTEFRERVIPGNGVHHDTSRVSFTIPEVSRFNCSRLGCFCQGGFRRKSDTRKICAVDHSSN